MTNIKIVAPSILIIAKHRSYLSLTIDATKGTTFQIKFTTQRKTNVAPMGLPPWGG